VASMESLRSGDVATSTAPQVDRQLFLEGMRAVPGVVAIIATSDGAERLGLVATAWTSLSADPPMMIACINRSATAHDDMLGNGAFSINLLDIAQEENVEIFSAKRGLSRGERFLDGCWSTGPAGQPLLVDGVVAFECSLEDHHEYGTHTVLIGRVGHVVAGGRRQALLYADGAVACAQRLEAADA
jgi:flavin reductase (DIM6/NTAB) family NADH-FMN oxidoreductase RutF